MDKIKVKNAKFTIKNDKIYLQPTGNQIIINFPISGHPKSKFIFELFVIITIISYLGIFLLTNYLADFNTLQHQSRIEIVFLTIFFVLLFIPMSHIDNSNKSRYERRELSKWHPLIENNEVNYKFGHEFNNWFTDRFLTRKAVVKALNDVYSYISFSVGIGKYYKDSKNDTLYPAFETNDKDAKEAQKYIKYLHQFNKFCNDNGIKLYVIIVPRKPAVYEPSFVKYNDENLKRIAEHERAVNNLNIIYPADEMKKESKNNYVYFKTEHHWTDSGAFVGYKEVMKLIKRDFPQVKVLTKDDFTYFTNKKVRGDFWRDFSDGITCDAYHIPKHICNKYLNTDYIYYKHKDFDNLQTKIIDVPYHRGKKFYYPKGADLRVILIGTSMSENLTEMIPFTFKNVYRLRTNDIKKISQKEQTKIMKYHKKDILNYKPDIIIFCIATNNMPGFVNIFKKN